MIAEGKFDSGEDDKVGLLLDALTNSLITIDYAHHETHAGSSFSAGFVDTAMADGDTIIIAFKTPPGTKRIHILGQYSTLVGGKMEMIEGPTWDQASGAGVTIMNHKRDTVARMTSSILLEDRNQVTFTASDEAMSNVTSLAGGTAIFASYAWGEKGKVAAVGGRGVNEFLLKPDTAYAARFTAIGGSNMAQVMLGWYEHTDKN